MNLEEEQMKSDFTLSREAGHYDNYLAEMKNRQNEKYKLVKLYGIRGYEDKFIEQVSKLADIFYKLKDMEHGSIGKFRSLYNQLYGTNVNHTLFHYWICVFPFKAEYRATYKAFKRNEQIIEAFDVFIKLKGE